MSRRSRAFLPEAAFHKSRVSSLKDSIASGVSRMVRIAMAHTPATETNFAGSLPDTLAHIPLQSALVHGIATTTQ